MAFRRHRGNERRERRNKLKTLRGYSYLRLGCGMSRRVKEETEKWWGHYAKANNGTEEGQPNSVKAI